MMVTADHKDAQHKHVTPASKFKTHANMKQVKKLHWKTSTTEKG